MHHYFEAITNRSGDSLTGYFGRVINPANQNTVPIYADDNGTPVVTVSGKDNMASTDVNGNLSFYVVPGTYHLDIYAPNGTSFVMRVSNVAMNSTKGDPGEPGAPGLTGTADNTYATLAALLASDPNRKSARLVPQAGETAPAGNFGYVGGAWIRQASDGITYQADSSAPMRSAQEKMTDTVSVKDYGATGLGVADDTAALKAAIAARSAAGIALNIPVELYIPAGMYRVTDTIMLPNNVTLRGDGPSLSVINGGNMQKPVIQTANAGTAYITLRKLTIAGGTVGFRSTSAQIAGGFIDTVSFGGQSILNVWIDSLLQLTDFVNTIFTGAPGGLKVSNPTTNAVNFTNCKFVVHDGSAPAFELNACESVNFYGGQFEASGSAGSSVPVIKLNEAKGLSFHGTYFENLSPVLLEETNSLNAVYFGGGCKFSPMKGDVGPRFVSNGYVIFGNNYWNLDAQGNFSYITLGHNNGLSGKGAVRDGPSIRRPSFNTGPITVGAGSGTTISAPIIKFTHLSSSATAFVSGNIRVTVIGYDTANGVPYCVSRSFHITAHAIDSSAIQGRFVAGNATGSELGINIVINTISSSVLRVDAQVTGVNNGTPNYISASFDGEENSLGTNGAQHIFVQPATYAGATP